MKTIYFATTNTEKIKSAQAICAQADIVLEPVSLDVDEIQGEDSELIVKDKARRAFELLGKPVVITDDTWDIPALNGFPGAYMKSMNHWFSAQDFLRLMNGVTDRRIILHQHLAYTDGKTIRLFKNDMPGTVIGEERGENNKHPHMTVTVFDIDKDKALAEVYNQDEATIATQFKNRPDAWREFIKWYKNSYLSR